MLRLQAAVSVQLWALALGVLAAFLFGVRSLPLSALQPVTQLGVLCLFKQKHHWKSVVEAKRAV